MTKKDSFAKNFVDGEELGCESSFKQLDNQFFTGNTTITGITLGVSEKVTSETSKDVKDAIAKILKSTKHD